MIISPILVSKQKVGVTGKMLISKHDYSPNDIEICFLYKLGHISKFFLMFINNFLFFQYRSFTSINKM